jgi:hypothetical protein
MIMKKSEIIDRSGKFAERYCVTNGKNFRLKNIDPGATDGAASEDKSRQLITKNIWDGSSSQKA